MQAKAIILFLLLTLSSNLFAKGKRGLKGKPTTLEETIPYLLEAFDDTSLYDYAIVPEQIATVRLHFGFGMGMRNGWGLWRNSDLKKYFVERGIYHADDMSDVILLSFHRYLNGDTLDLKERAAYYARYWQGNAPDGFSSQDLGKMSQKHYDSSREELYENYFKVGDTVLVTLSAEERKLFKTDYSGVWATARIKKRLNNDSLQLNIIDIEPHEGKDVDEKINENIEERYWECRLIPPKGWTREKLIGEK